ncbi:nucleoside triphosphate pyrophosphohydrolase [Salipaludibacillus sp. LMS25]|jgi:tetrapyrrole methylase family protein/MazG family protein|uniref:nucleoside triphosphate pyrophosphohydrolase n=1 Tax=Salipaludibacillus sp. LMS25 TaxID=2924031 RepID=UPI0020D07048|nr:nucleoside triphosphate pyrophosphohydrolase [Salipaludibacillus sp. LMS25]UTR16658.1 nucleoside triphosphate pyrophosphohydrolase [Salipaludibacillus sp. LMS25]
MSSTIRILGLGAGELDQLPVGIYNKLIKQELVFLRTEDHPVVAELKKEGMTFRSFDNIYETYDHFDEVYDHIVEELVEAVTTKGEIIYAVPGHPLVAEATVQRLLALDATVNVVIEGGHSFLDAIFTSLKIDPIDGFQLVDGMTMDPSSLDLTSHTVVAQVYDQMSASHVKLTLMERLPDDYVIHVVTAAGTAQESVRTVPLYELDRVTTLSNLTAVYLPPIKDDTLLYREFSTLRHVIKTLRGPNGCPWDKKQTHQSLKKYLLEETYEVLDAIDENDDDHLAEELGDVLLQVLLHAQISEDEGYFNMEDVIRSLTEKMIRRHPHVFGDKTANNAEEVVTNWEEIKQQEKIEKGQNNFLLDDIPSALPALLKAFQLQKKAAKVGFDWNDEAPMWMKLQEEISEWLQALKEGANDDAVEELGDVLFVLVNLARYHEIDPEEALTKTNNKFRRRFNYIEDQLAKDSLQADAVSLEKLDELWDKAKQEERKGEKRHEVR